MSKAKTELTQIDQPIYGYWQALYLSFISRRLYIDVGKRWKGLGLLYLLLVIAVFSIPLTIKLAMQFQDQFDNQIVYPMLQMPTLYVQNGIISIEKPEPYLVKNPQGNVVLVVDTSDHVPDYAKKYPYLTILVKKDTISFRLPAPNLNDSNAPPAPNTKPIVQDIDPSMNAMFDGASFISDPNIKHMRYTSLALIYPVVIAAVGSFFVVVYLVVAMLAQLFSTIFFTMQISYPQAIRLIIVSGTPMMLVLFIGLVISKKFTWMGFILIGILIIYYSFALQALRSEYKRIARS